MALKIVAHGFYWCGRDSYLRNSWNIMDFLIVMLGLELVIIIIINHCESASPNNNSYFFEVHQIHHLRVSCLSPSFFFLLLLLFSSLLADSSRLRWKTLGSMWLTSSLCAPFASCGRCGWSPPSAAYRLCSTRCCCPSLRSSTSPFCSFSSSVRPHAHGQQDP